MSRALTALLILATVILASAAPTEAAVLVVEMLPAPAGYSYNIGSPVEIIGYKVRDNYQPYGAKSDGVLIFDNPDVDAVVTKTGTIKLRVIKLEELYKAYAIDLSTEKSKDIIVYGAGKIYISRYRIYYDTIPPGVEDTHDVLLITTGYLDLRVDVSIHLVSMLESRLVVYKKDGTTLDTTLTDYLGVNDACVVWFQGRPPNAPWIGGIIPSPACIENLEILKYYELEGQLFGVVVKVGNIVFMFGRPTALALELAGFILPVNEESKVHVLAVDTLEGYYVYLAGSRDAYISIQPKVSAIDVTMVTKEGEYVCNLPRNYTLLYTLLWKKKEFKGQVKLEPGEIILYMYDNNVYLCRGDLSWLFSPTYPAISAPKYREMKHPFKFTGYNGNFLLVFSNGKVYIGPVVTIDYNEYISNRLFIVYGENMMPYIYVPPSFLTSPIFALIIIILIPIVGFLLRRRPEEYETIKVIWDILEPPEQVISTREEIRRAITKNIDNWGTCPDEHELIIRYRVLPPLEAVKDPRESVVYCPYRTNSETELILKKVAKLLLSGFWGLKREGRSHGYIFSFIGEQMLYMYWYKQEDELHPAEVLFNALKRAMRTQIITAVHTKPLGLLIVARDDMRRRLEKELERIKRMTPEGVPGYSFEQYFSIHLASVDVNLSKLQEFVSKQVPAIIVVSDKNLPVLVEFLSERYVSLMEEYVRVYGKFWQREAL